MSNFKTLRLATLAILALSSFSAVAQAPYGYSPYGNNGYGAPMPYNGAPYGNPYQQQRPYGMPYGGAPYSNNNGFNRFFNNGPMGNGGPFGGNRGFNNNGNNGFGEQFWPGRGSVYDDVLPANGPWNRSWGRAPWNRNYDDMWGRKGGPKAWFDPTDPKESMAQAWEDMLVTPNGLGTMPGGWKAPSISVPNPIDVGDEFKNVARDMPDEMQNFTEGFTYGDESWNGSNNNDGGGISFSPGNRR